LPSEPPLLWVQDLQLWQRSLSFAELRLAMRGDDSLLDRSDDKLLHWRFGDEFR
jgi:hypothetical protein